MTTFKVELDELAQMHVSILGLTYALEDDQLKADIDAGVAGSGKVAGTYDDFVHDWSDARAKIKNNLTGLGDAVLAALGAYREADRMIREAATPASSSGSGGKR